MADVPAVVHPNFEIIEHTSNGGLFLATSSLSGRLVIQLILGVIFVHYVLKCSQISLYIDLLPCQNSKYKSQAYNSLQDLKPEPRPNSIYLGEMPLIFIEANEKRSTNIYIIIHNNLN